MRMTQMIGPSGKNKSRAANQVQPACCKPAALDILSFRKFLALFAPQPKASLAAFFASPVLLVNFRNVLNFFCDGSAQP